MSGIKQEQTSGLERALVERQDRNISLTDGGALAWDSGTGILTWSGTLRLRVPGVGVYTIAPGSQADITSANLAVYVDINRSIAGVLTTGVESVTSVNNDLDSRVLLAVRSNDNRLVFRNGTVFHPGDSKTFGTLNAATDRTDVEADAVGPHAGGIYDVGFTYVPGSNQLVVMQQGLVLQQAAYTETNPTTVTFAAPPAPGDKLTFLNVVGGEGPSGAVLMEVFQGTTSDATATVIATGITNIKGITAAVFNSGTTLFQAHGFADPSTVGRVFHATWDATGNVTLSADSDGTGVLPAALRLQDYSVVVFY